VASLAGLSLHRGGNLHPAQYRAARDLSVGKLLIAKPDLADPNFAASVILIVHYDVDKRLSLTTSWSVRRLT
jgi:putative AlgH/UPF0301 family transcriptional regulator